jgi:hypothetical protein
MLVIKCQYNEMQGKSKAFSANFLKAVSPKSATQPSLQAHNTSHSSSSGDRHRWRGIVFSIIVLADRSCRAVQGTNCLRCSNAGVVGSNSTLGMDVCVPLFWLCCPELISFQWENSSLYKSKMKLSLYQSSEARRFVGRRGFRIF